MGRMTKHQRERGEQTILISAAWCLIKATVCAHIACKQVIFIFQKQHNILYEYSIQKRVFSENGAVGRIAEKLEGKVVRLGRSFIPTTPIRVQYIIRELSGVQICPDTYPIYQRRCRNFPGQKGRTRQ